MTKLTYMIGNEEIATYAEAQKRSAETKLPAVLKYTPIVERVKVNPERLAKIQRHFAKMRAERV